MSTPRALGRLLVAATVGLGTVAACAGAAPAGGAPGAWTPDGDADPTAKRNKPAEDAGPPEGDGGPRCPYGELTDPHRGFVRCLLPEERDAGWLPPPSQGEPTPPEPPKAEPPKPEPPRGPAPTPLVAIGAPTFENGSVTKVEKSLGKASAEIAKCVAEHGGLSGEAGSLKIQFLVRSRGRAEGVEVLAAKNVSSEAAACVRVLIKNKAIGAPSADPVGVTVVISLKPPR
jgi:hypothetical protein